MNPFDFNHGLFVFVIVAALVLMRSPGKRAALLTFFAVSGIIFAKSIHWILGFAYSGLSFFVLVSAWYFGRTLARRKPEESGPLLAFGMVVLFFPLFLFKLVMAILPVPVIAQLQQNIPGFDLSVLIPVGMSYFSFRSAAYLIEIRRRTIEPVGFWRFIHYALFWPTLFAGPIERPDAFFKQTESIKRPTRDDFVQGLARATIGFFKKAVLAAIFANIARPYLEMAGEFQNRLDAFSVPHLWICVTAYYFYLYLDFSAYSDLAIGVSRMMGFRIMENFRWPILATNVSEFWQRWHISLTSWVTDYIYRPLGGNRKGLARAAKYSTVAMVVVGVWHGMNMHFIAWGLYHAFFLILYRYWRKTYRARLFPDGLPGPQWLQTFIAWAITFHVVNMGWVLFKFKIGQSILIWLKMFGLGG